jgi:S1-C subfamily serine protease
MASAAWGQVTTTTTTTTAVPRAAAARVGCPGCPDSARARRLVLITKLDSLRVEFERRRMTAVDREVLSKEMTSTVMALQELIEAGMRAGMETGMRAGMAEVHDQLFVHAQAAPGARRSAQAGAVIMAYQSGSVRGYLGVTFDGPMLADNERDSVRFFRYPLIASVDPSSPAERAGVLRGDTLIALNGTDVIDHVFSFVKLLVPDDKITLKVRRQGDAKEFRVVVGEAPAYVSARTLYPTPAAPAAPAAGAVPGQYRVRAAPAPTARVVPPESPEPPDAPVAAFAYPGRTLFISSGVGGARLEPVSEGLAKNLGIKDGLLVSRVAPGSPSDRWGLREGDIILTAAGETMSSVLVFARVLEDRSGASDGVKVVVLREQKRQDLVLKLK